MDELLILSDFVKRFTSTLTKTEKLHNDFSVIKNFVAKLYF